MNLEEYEEHQYDGIKTAFRTHHLKPHNSSAIFTEYDIIYLVALILLYSKLTE